jgi:mannosyltransferase
MSSIASRARPLQISRALPSGVPQAAILLVVLLALSAFLRTRALGASLWMDEGLSIGIASQGFLHIPGVLLEDGSPPLYYMLLHVWMSLFGDGPGETQGLSVVIALTGVPAGLWAGWTLFGRRAGYIAAGLMALNPFLTTYAQETRMYSLMVVLSFCVTAAFLHCFVYRDRRYLPVFAVLLAAMLYTHNWGIFVTFGCLCAIGLVLWISDDRRSLLRDAALAFGGAFLLYLPWIPTLLSQAAHTGAPWVNKPRFGAPVQISKTLLAGGTATVALVLGAGSGLAPIVKERLTTRESKAVFAAAMMGVSTLAIAWLVSQVSPVWTTRYLGVALGPIFIIAALGLSRAGNLGLAALAIVLVIWAIPKTKALENKSNITDLGTAVSGQLRPGDLVISLQPEQTPLIDYNLPDGLSYATPTGAVHNPRVMDWRDALGKLEDARPGRNLAPLLAKLPPASHVLLVHPVTSKNRDWDAPWTQLVRRRSAQWGQALAQDKQFERTAVVPRFYRRAGRIGVRGVLYTKKAT